MSYYDLFTDNLKTYITQGELLAPIAALYSAPHRFAGRKVIMFVDNSSALSAIINGYSGKPDLARMVNMFHIATTALCIQIWGEWVPSDANVADIPTRPEKWHLIPEWVVWMPMKLPPLRVGAEELRAWFDYMRAEFTRVTSFEPMG
jgi:hypothetical protein